MPKIIAADELDAIVAMATRHGGIGLEALGRAFPQLPRRTLQRRLARLVETGRLVPLGRHHADRYRLPPPHVQTIPTPGSAADVAPATGLEPVIPLTPAGAEVRALVRRHLAERTPVGYHRAFLDRYIPNVTHYLPVSARHRLHELGRSPVDGQAAGTYARQILSRLLVDLSWASSRLEGNTYTRLDTQNLIDFGQAATGKDQLETQMILNHKAAIEMIVESAEEVGFNAYTFHNLHALLADNLLVDPAASGRLRRIPVQISGTVYQPTAIPQVLDECFQQILTKAEGIRDPFEQALFVMVHIPYLQPFEDINKRVSRLGANIPLIRDNLSPLSFVDVPEKIYVEAMLGIYELNRVELLVDVFTWAYERSCQRYTVLKDALPTPNPLRLRYRAELRKIIGWMVRSGSSISPDQIRSLAVQYVDGADLDEFAAIVSSELHHLHDGNLARYGLRLSEFRAWQAALASPHAPTPARQRTP